MRRELQQRRERSLGLAVALLGLSCVEAPRSSSPKPAAPVHTVRDAGGPKHVRASGVQRAFEAQPGFSQLTKPQPGEWLYEFRERGQSVGEFERAPRVVPTDARRTLFIQPIGRFEQGHGPPLDVLGDYVQRFFGLDAHVLPQIDELPARKRIRGRVEQLLTGDLLEGLRLRLPAAAYGLVGVTMSDLFPAPTWNYVFGEARFTERVGVYSFARHDPRFHGERRRPGADQLILARSLKVMTHEIGHMFGIAHCTAFRCLMNGSNSLAETDRAPMHLCPVCLHKLHIAVGFSPAQRYETLAEFYRSRGFASEATWVEARLGYLTQPARRSDAAVASTL